MAAQFQYLFTPLEIGPVTVRNRILITGHAREGGFDGVEVHATHSYRCCHLLLEFEE